MLCAIQKKRTIRLLLFIVVFLVLCVPFFVGAQQQEDPTELQIFLNRLGIVLGRVIGLVSAVALLGFVTGIVKFIFHSGDEDKRKEGKKMMLWSVFAIFIMVSLWGAVALLQSTFSYDELNNRQEAPCLESGFFGGQEGCN